MDVKHFAIEGPALLVGARFHDNRGYFSESYNQSVFDNLIGPQSFCQDNVSFSRARVFRGLHWQLPPFEQGKLVTCLQGAIRDFIVDVRQGSPTFGQFLEVQLSGDELETLWVPPGFAHGFLAITDGTIVHYKVTNFWNRQSERSLSPFHLADFDAASVLLSEKDAVAPKFSDLSPEDLF